MLSNTYSYTELTYKQRLQYELIDIIDDLGRFKLLGPQTESLMRRIQDTIGRCIQLMDGADVRELCHPLVV
jgi:hypothetical protein